MGRPGGRSGTESTQSGCQVCGSRTQATPPQAPPLQGLACCPLEGLPVTMRFHLQSCNLQPQLNLLWAQRKTGKFLLILDSQDPRPFQVATGMKLAFLWVKGQLYLKLWISVTKLASRNRVRGPSPQTSASTGSCYAINLCQCNMKKPLFSFSVL